jgi:hypothetical protein
MEAKSRICPRHGCACSEPLDCTHFLDWAIQNEPIASLSLKEKHTIWPFSK